MGEIGPDVPSEVELQFVVSRNPSFPPRLRKYNRTSPVRIEIAAPVMTSSRSAAKAALSFLESRPRGSRRRLPLLPVPLSAAFGAVMQHYPRMNSSAMSSASLTPCLHHRHTSYG